MWRFVILLTATVVLLAPTPSEGGTDAAELAFSRGGAVWTIRADGPRARLLLRNAYAPAWSPDGSRLPFVSRRSGDEEISVARATAPVSPA